MKTDKEIVKAKISELSNKIRNEEDEHVWESYELKIVVLIIDYSIRHEIEIPLIRYDLYSLQRLPANEGTGGATFKRRKIDENDTEEDKYRYREDHQYFRDFKEAIGEEGLINPRFKIHPEIRELVDCWRAD